MTANEERTTKLMKVMDRYCEVTQNGFEERWKKWDIKIYDSETHEVIGGLLARQATLSIYLAQSPSVWNGHVAPLFLRAMTDAHITLAWILREPAERSRKYILYGLGQEKLNIEHLKSAVVDEEDKERIENLIDIKQAWLNSQRADFLTEVNVGNWSGLNTREMAQEAECEGLYKFAYTPFSAIAHNMWQHVSTHNLKFCTNPLHKYHKIPNIADLPLDPDYVYRSAKYVDKSYAAFDANYKLSIETPMPSDWFVDEMNKLFEEES